MPEYLYLIHPYREGFFEKPTSEESSIMEDHFQYLKDSADKGTVLLAGPCLDGTFGLILLRAKDEEAAQNFMLNDPSVKKNVMAAELHPLRLSLVGRGLREGT